MKRTVMLMIAMSASTALLTGCGLAETAVSGAAGATSAAQEAKEGKKMEEKVKADIEAAQQQALAQRKAAEAAATESPAE